MPADTLDLDGDGDIVEPVPLDGGGRDRFVDDPDTPDTGVPGPPVVDMGAHENQACPADFDDTGDVGVVDLLALLAAWGACS